jgi:hypothetical protein
MKTTSRTRRNGSAAGITKQSSTPASHPVAPANGVAHAQRYAGKVNLDTWRADSVALVLMSGTANSPEDEIAGLNFSRAEFERIKAMAGNSATGLAEFLRSAIELRLNHHKAAAELQAASNQSLALTELLEHLILQPQDADWSEDLKAGLVELSGATFGRLRNANAALAALVTEGRAA